MLTITMSVEFEELNDATIRSVAAMLVFPMEVHAITFEFNHERKLFQLQFAFVMNGNSATSSVIFKRGTSIGVGNLLDAMPHPTFLSGTEFLMAWNLGEFDAEIAGPVGRSIKLEFPNSAMVNVG
jgi:hypothetical protein